MTQEKQQAAEAVAQENAAAYHRVQLRNGCVDGEAAILEQGYFDGIIDGIQYARANPLKLPEDLRDEAQDAAELQLPFMESDDPEDTYEFNNGQRARQLFVIDGFLTAAQIYAQHLSAKDAAIAEALAIIDERESEVGPFAEWISKNALALLEDGAWGFCHSGGDVAKSTAELLDLFRKETANRSGNTNSSETGR